MYFQSDYILRMIEMGTGFYRRLVEMLRGETSEQREALAEASLSGEMLARVGLDMNAVRAMSPETLAAILPDPGSRAVLMEHLFAAFELMESAPDRDTLAVKALTLLSTIPPESVTAEHLYARARLMLGRMEGGVDPALHAALAAFFESVGHYDAAEDHRHFAGDAHALADFYRRMLRLSDTALQCGGLTRAEVETAAGEGLCGGA